MSSLKPNIDINHFKLTPEQKASGAGKHYDRKTIPLEQIEKEFDSFESIDFNNPIHREEILSMFPEYLITESDKADMDLFLAMSRHDRKHQTFIAGCFENQSVTFQLLSHKWHFKDDSKWKTRYGTHPNSTPFVRIATDDKPIYFIEGHKDSLAAILLGLDFVMLPNAGYKYEKYPSLSKEVEARDIIFLVEDEAAHKCMFPLSQVLAETAKSIILKLLSGQSDEKMDLSDYIQNFKTVKEVINGL